VFITTSTCDYANGGRLELKSSRPGATGDQPAHVVLCTPTQTYDLRQVQTSNTVFILRTEEFQDAETATSSTGVCAFAKCGSMLEIHPQVRDEKSKVKTAKQILNGLLRVYRGPEDDPTDTSSQGFTKMSLFADIPYSIGECEAAWQDLMAFEMSKTCWQPHPEQLLQLWQTILEGATADGINLTRDFAMESLRLAIEELNAPEEMFVALMSYLCKTDRNAVSATLDRARMIEWVGRTIVAVNIEQPGSIDVEALYATWRNSLPENWRNDASLETLSQFCADSKVEKVNAASLKMDAEVVSALGKRPAKGRDWHERFKKTRK